MKLTLLNDLVFKYLFARDEHREILCSLLNALLHYEGKGRIAGVQIKNPFVAGTDVTSKKIVLDVNAEDERGRHFTIEMQVKPDDFYVERVVFYGAKLHTDQLPSGSVYRQLEKTVSISILDHRLFACQEMENAYRLLNLRDHSELSEQLEYQFFELPKLGDREVSRSDSAARKWLYFIKESEHYSDPEAEVPEALLEEEAIAMALDAFRRMSASEEVHMLVEEREKAKRDWNHMMYEAHLSGIEKGMAAGKEEGIAIGREEGRAEKAEAERRLQEEKTELERRLQEEKVEAERRFREMAREMKAVGIESSVIAEVTGLAAEEIQEL